MQAEIYADVVTRAVEVESTGQSFFDYAYEQGWTDGLPVEIPTPDRVAAMIAASCLPADEVIGTLAPRGSAATVEIIAVNAVMAGCVPAHMPVLIAATRALSQPEMNLAAVQATTSPATPVLFVNGPAAVELGFNVGRGCLGPGNRTNATIGRAVRLLLINVGGGLVDSIDKATMGLPAKYTFSFAENEADSPWESFSADRGFASSDSTVTITSVVSALNIRVPDPKPDSLDVAIDLIADGLAARGSKHVQGGDGSPIVVLSPGLAKIFAQNGYTKESLQQAFFDRARRPSENYVDQAHTSYRRADGEVLVTSNPDRIGIVVAGGPEPNQVVVLASFVDSALVTELVAPLRCD